MYNPYYNTNLFGEYSTPIVADYIAAQSIPYMYTPYLYVGSSPSLYSAYISAATASALYHQPRSR